MQDFFSCSLVLHGWKGKCYSWTNSSCWLCKAAGVAVSTYGCLIHWVTNEWLCSNRDLHRLSHGFTITSSHTPPGHYSGPSYVYLKCLAASCPVDKPQTSCKWHMELLICHICILVYNIMYHILILYIIMSISRLICPLHPLGKHKSHNSDTEWLWWKQQRIWGLESARVALCIIC